MRKINWRNTVEPERYFHLAGSVKKKLNHLNQHNHDFPEVFWIKSGKGAHCINNNIINLRTGNVVFIRPFDCHTFRIDNGEEMEMVNLAFPIEKLLFYKSNYFNKDLEFPWLSNSYSLPLMILLNAKSNLWIGKEFEKLSFSTYSSLDLDCFLLNLFIRLNQTSDATVGSLEECPDWLKKAIVKMKEPNQIHKNTNEFIQLCCKSPEHVNRTIKKIYQNTTTEFVNKIKVDYAKSKLQITNDAIIDISLSCGFNHLGNFYKIFKRVYRETPNECRKKARKIL